MNESQRTRNSRSEARRRTTAPRRAGFTLVELMVAITIIAILASIAVPAVMYAIGQGRNTAMRMEVSGLEQAVQQYEQKYGFHPPDGSSWPVLNRHMGSIFPRMAEPDLTLLTKLTHPSGSFSPLAMDRAEALVFFLGGFSSDIQHPLTGQGGPLEYMGSGDLTDLNAYQYNATRDNALFDFEPQRIPLARAGGRYVSADEQNYGVTDPAHGIVDNMPDLLPVYLVEGGEYPIVYFDSRTYGDVGGGTYNGYSLPGSPGGCRPYKTGFDHDVPMGGGSYGSVAAAFDAVKFKNPDSFQIISPGRDGIYGTIVEAPPNSGVPVHFTVETGSAVYPNDGASNFNGLVLSASGRKVTGFQEVGIFNASENGQYDNITNFSGTTLEGDLEE